MAKWANEGPAEAGKASDMSKREQLLGSPGTGELASTERTAGRT